MFDHFCIKHKKQLTKTLFCGLTVRVLPDVIRNIFLAAGHQTSNILQIQSTWFPCPQKCTETQPNPFQLKHSNPQEISKNNKQINHTCDHRSPAFRKTRRWHLSRANVVFLANLLGNLPKISQGSFRIQRSVIPKTLTTTQSP